MSVNSEIGPIQFGSPDLEEEEYTEDEEHTLRIGDIFKVCQINVEGLTRDKSEYLGRLMHDNKCDVLLMQETHSIDATHLTNIGQIPDFICVDSIHHRYHGIATYVRQNLIDQCSILEKSDLNGVSIIIIKVNSISIMNLYKPPNVQFENELPNLIHPAVYIGDFNSHSSLWGYAEDDVNGEFIVNWAINNRLHLMYDAKEPSTFHSGRWNRDYNPDVCFVSTDDEHKALPAIREVGKHFPRSQHRPVFLDIGIQIPIIKSLPRPRWNFQKADWDGFSKAVDSNIRWIHPLRCNYDRFVGVLIGAAKKNIPRGFRKKYIPRWNTECEELYNLYKENGSRELGAELLRNLNTSRTEYWREMVQSLDFKHSSRKAWEFLSKFGGRKNKSQTEIYPISPNKIASRMVANSKVSVTPERKKQVERQLRRAKKKIRNSPIAYPVTVEEIGAALLHLKSGKACGFDNLFPEFYLHMGLNAKKLLSKFYSNLYEEGKYQKFGINLK